MPRTETKEFTADGLAAIREAHEEFAVTLQAIEEGMRDREISALSITRVAEMLKGLKASRAFCGAAKQAYQDHRINGGA